MARLKTAVIVFAVVVIAAITAELIRHTVYLNNLRAEMNGLIVESTALLERGSYSRPPVSVQPMLDARSIAKQLRDERAERIIDAQINLFNTVIRADTYYYEGSYHPARSAYRAALLYASELGGTGTRYIESMLDSTGRYIGFIDTMQRAGSLAGSGEYEAALPLYIEALQMASVLSYADGYMEAAEGMASMEEQIALAKWLAEMRLKAEEHIAQGDLLLIDGDYTSAVEEYQNAREAYLEIDDTKNAGNAGARIAYALHRLEEDEAAEEPVPGGSSAGATPGGADTPDETGPDSAAETVYESNLSIYFDLSSMIDRQDSGPASRIKMGAADDRNEGWYNGCGWIATYNILIKLGDPRHPADIVRYFEENRGTVMDGEYGTYPHAIEEYLIYLGHNVSHMLFPQFRLDIDSEIKAAGAAILAYAHTSAAHYVMIEYREEGGIFIVYNDSLARAYSREQGLSGYATEGAAVDSVELWLAQTRQILFPFSLITAEAS